MTKSYMCWEEEAGRSGIYSCPQLHSKFKTNLSYYVCRCGYGHAYVWRPEYNFVVESILSFHLYWVLGIELRSPGLLNKCLPTELSHWYFVFFCFVFLNVT